MKDISISVAVGDDLAEVKQLYKFVGCGGGVSANDVTIVAKLNFRLIGAVHLSGAVRSQLVKISLSTTKACAEYSR